MTKVSVCMAVHNGAEFIQEQINSILPQLEDGDEIVISDDNSEDQTCDIIKSFIDPRVKFIGSRGFNDPIKNFEFALRQCRNDVIFLADQDDIWHANKIAVLKNALKDCDLCVCDSRIVDKNLNEIVTSFFHVNNSRPGLVTNFVRNSFTGCCMAFDKKVLSKALPFPERIPMHDLWIGLVAEKYYKVKFIPQILVDHRRHENNYSSTATRSRNSFGKKVISRFMLAKNLLLR